MKAYQVFKGDLDKQGAQYFELDSTYLDKEKALQQCGDIVKDDMFKKEIIVESEWYCDGKCKSWDTQGWEWITICKFEEIEITE